MTGTHAHTRKRMSTVEYITQKRKAHTHTGASTEMPSMLLPPYYFLVGFHAVQFNTPFASRYMMFQLFFFIAIAPMRMCPSLWILSNAQ